MDSSRRGSLKGLTLEELKRSTTTSSPPAVFVQNRRTSELSGRLSSLGLQTRTPSPFSLRQARAPSDSLPGSSPSPSPSDRSCLDAVNSSHVSNNINPNTPSFDFSYPSMVREQEPARNPLAPSSVNSLPQTRVMENGDVKNPASPRVTNNDYSEQNVASPQPVFGRPTQLGAASQPFSRHQPLQSSSHSGAQRLSGGQGLDGHNHLFISNKSGNRRPDFQRLQMNSNPSQSLHKPPSGNNPLSQLQPGPSRNNGQNPQEIKNNARPRNTRIIDSSDDDDVFEIPKPVNLPTWQPRPVSYPTFSSLESTNPYFQPKQPTAIIMTKSSIVASTTADGGIWEDRYNTADPSIYLDSGKANEELKALFEGSVEDEDEVPRARRKKKGPEAISSELSSKIKALDVESTEKDQTQQDDEEEEEDDGTVEGLKVKLLPHQIEGVEWMRIKERGKGKGKGMTKGGILADDMGLGKTIQSIALILTNKPPVVNEEKSDAEIKYDKCTLIVAPLALIKQWEAELKDRVEPSHAFKICVHHGPQRAKSFKDLRKYDIVITTYQTLSSEYAACSQKIRAGCFGINWYRLILDEAHTIKNRTAKVNKAACALEAKYRWCLTGTPMQNNLDELQSLINFLQIGPLDKLEFWKSRIIQPMNSGRGGLAIKRLQTALKGLMKRRTKDVLKQAGALKTGSTEQSGKSNDTGFKIVKRTVEKVEAEFSREERAFYSRLESRIDQNLEKMMAGDSRVNYASALVLLLRLRQACNHAKLLGFDLAGERDALGDGTQTPRKQAGDDLDDLTMRLGGLNVEMRQCDICQVELSKEEIDDSALRCRECEDDLAGQINVWKPKQSKKKETKAIIKNDRKTKRKVIIDSDDEDEEDIKPAVRSRSVKLEDSSDEEADDSESDQQEEDDDDDDEQESDYSSEEDSQPSIVASTKIRHLLSILRNDSHTHKYIIFSFFTSMLDLIEPFLYQYHIKFVRYDGSMRNDAREASLHSLRSDPTTRVLLCSLRAGSLGLNLTAASRVVILEPFWNPFVEEQAIDRVHRLNQTQDVVVYKLTIKDTVEARILELQEKKRELARVTVEGGASGAKGQVAKLTLAEMMKLFEHVTERDAMVDMLGMKDGRSLLDRDRGESTAEQWEQDQGRGDKGKAKKVWRKKEEHQVYGRRW